MDKSSKQIEEDAVDFLKLALKKSKHINREISEGDREPIWDGHIYNIIPIFVITFPNYPCYPNIIPKKIKS